MTQGRTILLDPDPPAWNSPVWLPSARFGVEAPGRFQRLDGVMVELQPVLQGDRPLMKDLLLELTREEPPA
jgi:formylmethanofuran dehydrogenase subunit B